MGYSSAQAKNFIAEIAPFVQKYAKEYGYQVASPILAQAVCESAAATSSLGYKYHNYFGLKAGSQKKGTKGVWDGTVVNLKTKEEYTPGTLTEIKSLFRVYKTMEEGIEGYFEFLMYSRYANLKSATTPEDFLTKIKADGYCTSSTYVTTNMNIVNKYNLTKYDWVVQSPNTKRSNKDIAIEVIYGHWGSGDDRIKRLTEAGYDYKTIQHLVNEMLK